jgi:dTDP-4-dehydrorhamnose reductase
MLPLAKQGTQLKIVNDQIGAPTSSSQLAQATAQVLHSAVLETDGLDKLSGLYHLSAAGQTSWYGFALAIFKQAVQAGQLSSLPDVIPISSADYPTAARRPMNSVMSNQKFSSTFGFTLPDWESALAQVLPEQPA